VLEIGWAKFLSRAEGVSVRKLIITVRHHDWWSWEDDSNFRMDVSDSYGAKWRRGFLSFPMLDEFQMELETLERRREALDEVVQHVRTWRIPLGHGKVLSTEGMDINSEVWMGTVLGEAKGRLTEGIQSIPYRVARIKWRSVDAREGENIEDSE
jgi:hypothetical protein